MYIRRNINPYENDTGDCVIRAIALIEGKDWDDVFLELMIEAYTEKLMIEDNRLWTKYLRKLGYKRHSIPDTCPDCYSANDFARDNPRGRFIVCTGTHVIGIIDGTIYDTWDSSDKTVLFYFEKGE